MTINLDRRAFLGGLTASACAACCEVPGRPERALAWKDGHFQIHMIYTGMCESLFLVFPDGTSMLLDCGDTNPRTFLADRFGDGSLPILPSESRRAGEWIARYVERVNPHGNRVDYMFLSHFHADHSGSITNKAGVRTDLLPGGEPYHRSGFSLAAETLRFRHAIDRGWPDYDEPLPWVGDERWRDGSLTLMRQVYRYLGERDGLSVEKFRVGETGQVRMLHDAAAHAGFSVFNICGNGKIAMRDGSVFDCYHEIARGRRLADLDENALSLGMVFTYGDFRFYTAGDFSDDREKTTYRGEKLGFEQLLARQLDAVTVAKANHHACWGNPAEIVAALRPEVWLVPVWWRFQATRETMNGFSSRESYPGDRLILPGCVCDSRLAADLGQPYLKDVPPEAIRPSHVVIDVSPGGREYVVALVDPSDELDRIKFRRQVVAGSGSVVECSA